MRLSRQFQVCLFFYKKILNAQKAPKRKTNNFCLPRSFCAREKLLPFLFACFCFVGWFLFVTCCRAFKNFRTKKQAWNYLDNLIYYTTDVYFYQLTLWRIRLYALIFMCDHLWESLLFMRIFLNLFLFKITCVNLFS